MDSVRRALLAALVLTSSGPSMQPVWAQPQGAPPAAAATAPRAPVAPPLRGVELPPVPHELNPTARPYPEYVAEALKLTGLTPDERFRSIRLRHASAAALRHLVLPVQTQAFGFAPGFGALVAAELDHALVRHQVLANRQTDVLDAAGPFARRLDEPALQELAKAYPAAALLGLYIGHDGADKAFISLEIREGTRRRVAHRELPLSERPRDALAAMAALLPALLNELGFAAAAASPTPAAAETACPAGTWALGAAPARAGPLLACHAIALGGLLPEFDERRTHFPPTITPAKLAWLATAWVEASRWPAGGPTAAAIQDLAWAQLRLDGAAGSERALVASADPVVRPLARMLSARQRSATAPTSSVRQETERLVEEAALGLADFTRAVFIERGNAEDGFRRVDLCGLERRLPGTMPSSRCRAMAEAGAAAPGTASPAQTLLFQEWRLAAAHKDIHHYGYALGRPDRLAEVLGALPQDVARHPFIRQQRFITELAERTAAGDFKSYLERVKAQATSFVQATADVQRSDAALAGYSISAHSWVQNTNVLSDPLITKLTDDEFRVLQVLEFDRFVSKVFPPKRRLAGDRAPFLAKGSAREASWQPYLRRPLAAASAASGVAPPAPPVRGLFRWTGGGMDSPAPTEAELREAIDRDNTDIDARLALAMRLLKQGRPEAEARRVIDEQPADQRSDQRISESHLWAKPGHAYFFAGDLDTARHYYRRVRDIGSGSSSDLHARARLQQIDGNFQASFEANGDRLRRYDSDYTRRDVAGLLFMAGTKDQAWPLLLPRLNTAATFQLWNGVLVGHRLEGTSLQGIVDWATQHGLNQAQIRFEDSVSKYLHLHAIVDRVPSAADAALLRGSGQRDYRSQRWATSAELAQMALRNDVAGFGQARRHLELSDPASNRFMQPLFTWVAWHATGGKEPELAAVREAELGGGNFEALLSKSMLLALEGRLDDSLAFLRAARWQMSELGLGSDNVERPIPSGYSYALAAWLMFSKTRHEPYRAEALRFARAHQVIFPYASWAYGLEALLESNEKPRALAICRAAHLDPASHFLKLAREKAGARAPACKGAPWTLRR